MKKINFVKYNKTRREAFQIRTSLVEENGLPYVEKTALTAEGIPHIRSFEEKYKNLTEQNQGLHVADVTVSSDGTTARFAFLKGETYAEILGRQIVNGKVPEASLEDGISMILKVHDDYMTPFHITPEFEEVFGVLPDTAEQIRRDWAFKHSNIDCLFENIMMTEDGPYCLDYEWVFSFPVPVNFIKFRVLYYFMSSIKAF
ncbi:hypothetical protein [Lacrimispora xylanisolvens]|uniref:hypothetical protein n=1 Tax=Lacrimispora xylanisolvens TaxID=384636 RepID=UPI0024027DFF